MATPIGRTPDDLRGTWDLCIHWTCWENGNLVKPPCFLLTGWLPGFPTGAGIGAASASPDAYASCVCWAGGWIFLQRGDDLLESLFVPSSL